MAIYHMTVKMGQRSAGQSSVASAAYRSGSELFDERTGESFNYERKGGIVASGILAPEDAPEWASDRSKLWNAVEKSETRKNSQVYREFEMALPGELTTDQQRDLVVTWVDRELLSRGMVADVNMHDTGKGNPHVHIMATTRLLSEDGEGFGAKDRSWNDKALLKEWRQSWAAECNQSLERAGHESRVDHRSHRERGIEMEPQLHHGNRSGLRMKNEAIKSRNVERVELPQQAAELVALSKTRAEQERHAQVMKSICAREYEPMRRADWGAVIDLKMQREEQIKEQLMPILYVKGQVVGQYVKTLPGIGNDWLILRDEAGIDHRARVQRGARYPVEPGMWISAKGAGLEPAQLAMVEDPAVTRQRQAAARAEAEAERRKQPEPPKPSLTEMLRAAASKSDPEQERRRAAERATIDVDLAKTSERDFTSRAAWALADRLNAERIQLRQDIEASEKRGRFSKWLAPTNPEAIARLKELDTKVNCLWGMDRWFKQGGQQAQAADLQAVPELRSEVDRWKSNHALAVKHGIVKSEEQLRQEAIDRARAAAKAPAREKVQEKARTQNKGRSGPDSGHGMGM